jgi:hypothetical protein
LANKFSNEPQDQIIYCDYLYKGKTATATFKITVAKPYKLTNTPSTTTSQGDYLQMLVDYQLIDQFGNNLQCVYDGVRVANLLMGESFVFNESPPKTLTPTLNGVVSNGGTFQDKIRLFYPADWNYNQFWVCHITKWTSPGPGSGNAVRENNISVDSGEPDIIFTNIGP